MRLGSIFHGIKNVNYEPGMFGFTVVNKREKLQLASCHSRGPKRVYRPTPIRSATRLLLGFQDAMTTRRGRALIGSASACPRHAAVFTVVREQMLDTQGTCTQEPPQPQTARHMGQDSLWWYWWLYLLIAMRTGKLGEVNRCRNNV